MAQKKQPLPRIKPAEDKQKALAKVLGDLEKAHGKGTIMRLGENIGID